MWFPWFGRIETRAAEASYTDAVVDLLQQRAAGTASGGNPHAIAATEIAASLWGRAFQAADVRPQSTASAAITPAVLELIGRGLILKGEALFVIEVDAGAVRLDPAASWTVSGGSAPDTWRYEVTRAGPSRTRTTRRVRPERVVHVRYAVDPARPWAGCSPLASAKLTAALAANSERRLGEEANQATGALLATPDGMPKDQLQEDLRGIDGRIVLAESTAGGWGAGREQAPRRDLAPHRIGADPPTALVGLRSDAALAVLAACGVPPELAGQSQGTAAREAYRRFLHGTVAPVALAVADELADKLALDALELNHDRLFASDLSGRARAFQSMVNGGLAVDKAAALAGLMEQDG